MQGLLLGRGTHKRWPQGQTTGDQQEPDDMTPWQPAALESIPIQNKKSPGEGTVGCLLIPLKLPAWWC